MRWPGVLVAEGWVVSFYSGSVDQGLFEHPPSIFLHFTYLDVQKICLGCCKKGFDMF